MTKSLLSAESQGIDGAAWMNPGQNRNDAHELALLIRVAQGDRASFEELYRAYYHGVARFLTRFTRREDLVEEIINDTFWVVWRKAGGFRGDSRVSTWIMGVAHRCALKAFRHDDDGPAERVVLREDEHPAEVPATAQEQRDWILRALAQLPAEQRATIHLAYYQGHSCDEIAAIMDCAVNTVKARLFRARLRLRNLLPALGGAEDGGQYESNG